MRFAGRIIPCSVSDRGGPGQASPALSVRSGDAINSPPDGRPLGQRRCALGEARPGVFPDQNLVAGEEGDGFPIHVNRELQDSGKQIRRVLMPHDGLEIVDANNLLRVLQGQVALFERAFRQHTGGNGVGQIQHGHPPLVDLNALMHRASCGAVKLPGARCAKQSKASYDMS